MSGWIGVDLDGTLAHYDEWRGIEHIGDLVEAMRIRVLRWCADGVEVKIFTARVHPEDTREEVIGYIHAWLEKHGMPKLEVTNVKDFGMIELWDDRCVQVIPNLGCPVSPIYAGRK